MPRLVLVAGPNGSGKTTLVRQGVLAALFETPLLSINPDDVAREIATGGQLSPEISLRAAQVSDARLDEAIAVGRSVMVETVLSSNKLMDRVATARAVGYDIVLIYITLRDGRLNVARVAQRHAQGGHNVPADRVLRRRSRSHALFEWFARQADTVLVFDNTATPTYVAGYGNGSWDIVDLGLLAVELADTIRSLAAEQTN